MTARNLDRLFKPQSVALIGASDRPTSATFGSAVNPPSARRVAGFSSIEVRVPVGTKLPTAVIFAPLPTDNAAVAPGCVLLHDGVLRELQAISDSGDPRRRQRGRRGLVPNQRGRREVA